MAGRWVQEPEEAEFSPWPFRRDIGEATEAVRYRRFWREDPPLYQRARFSSPDEVHYWVRLCEHYRRLINRADAHRNRREIEDLRARIMQQQDTPEPPRPAPRTTDDSLDAWVYSMTGVPTASTTTTTAPRATVLDRLREDMRRNSARGFWANDYISDWVSEDHRDKIVSMPMPLHASYTKDPDDPFLRDVGGAWRTSYIAVPMPETERIFYWETLGNVSQEMTKRILSRYYATAEARAKLFNAATSRAPRVLHPNPDKLCESVAMAHIEDWDAWCRGTASMRSERIVALIDGDWYERGERATDYRRINPHRFE